MPSIPEDSMTELDSIVSADAPPLPLSVGACFPLPLAVICLLSVLVLSLGTCGFAFGLGTLSVWARELGTD